MTEELSNETMLRVAEAMLKAGLRVVREELAARLPDHPEVTVEYFVPDDRKAGGRRNSTRLECRGLRTSPAGIVR